MAVPQSLPVSHFFVHQAFPVKGGLAGLPIYQTTLVHFPPHRSRQYSLGKLTATEILSLASATAIIELRGHDWRSMPFSLACSRHGSIEEDSSGNLETNRTYQDAIDCLDNLLIPADSVSYASLLRQCGDLSKVKWIHRHIIETGHADIVLLGNLLMQMYGQCGALEDARDVFDSMFSRNVFSWSIMIEAYVHNEQSRQGLLLFHQMLLEGVVPDKVLCLSVLDSCDGPAALTEGHRIHACTVGCDFEADVVVGTAIVDMYDDCGSLQDALRMFHKMPERNTVSWTVMIAAHAHHGRAKEALALFEQMTLQGIIPNKATFLVIIDSCAGQLPLTYGEQIHTHIVIRGLESDLAVGTALINLYAKCGKLEDAQRLFDKMAKRDVISWNAMIGAYAQHQQTKKALLLLEQMQLEGVIPDKVTWINLLDGCASNSALAEAKHVHALVVDSGCDLDAIVGTSIVNMYGKCGSLEDARHFFHRMPSWDVVSWSALIAAYARHGQGKKVVQLFQEMQVQGEVPNEVTFFSVLSACSHSGLMDEGWHVFQCMSEMYNVTPTVQHYNCLIDLLGRAGHLHAGELLISNMPVQPNAASWLTLLGACKMSDILRGNNAAKKIWNVDLKNLAAHVSLSNIHANKDLMHKTVV